MLKLIEKQKFLLLFFLYTILQNNFINIREKNDIFSNK